MSITMGGSAFWHGIYPGYYLSLLTVPLVVAAEDAMQSAFRNGKPPAQQTVFDWINWFLKMRMFDYMCMAFLLLSAHDTLRYWRSIYFLGHIIVFIFMGIGIAFKPKHRSTTTDNKKDK